MITKLVAENFKRLVAVQIEPSGALVTVSGRNGAGKSSVLDAIFAALAGSKALPPAALRRGEKDGFVEVHLDAPPVIVRRKFGLDGETSLTVESRDGARFPSPQRMLDDLLGALSFDPLAFLAKKPADQVATLLDVVDLSVDVAELERLTPGSVEPDPILRLDLRHRTLYDERTEKNREAKRVEGELIALPAPREDDPAGTVNISLLVRERDELQIEGERQRNVRAGIDQLGERAATLKRDIERLSEELRAVSQRRADLAGEDAAFVDPAPAIAALDEQIENAEAVNERYNQVIRRKEVEQRLRLVRAAADARTKHLDEIAAFRASTLAAARMPVEGLGFADGAVTFGGLPLEQASQAEQLRVSVAIAAALNPKLKVMLVREGSLLDSDSTRLLAELAARHGAQVWLEVVDTSGKVGVVIEDGSVASVNLPEDKWAHE